MKSYINAWGREVQQEDAGEPGTYVNAFGRRVPVDPTADVRQEGGVHVNAFGRPVPDGYGSGGKATAPAGAGRQVLEAAEAEITAIIGAEEMARVHAAGKQAFIVEEIGRMVPLTGKVA